MKDEGKPFSPTCQPLLPASSTVATPNEGDAPPKDEGVKMRKELGLMEGTSIILGIIMGSGKPCSYICTFIYDFLKSWFVWSLQAFSFLQRVSWKMPVLLVFHWLSGFFAVYFPWSGHCAMLNWELRSRCQVSLGLLDIVVFCDGYILLFLRWRLRVHPQSIWPAACLPFSLGCQHHICVKKILKLCTSWHWFQNCFCSTDRRRTQSWV